jgi:hypothetical protein
MSDDYAIKKQRDRTDELRFIKTIQTPLNPRDIYYKNQDEEFRWYLILLLLGVMMVFYFWIY